MAVRNFFNKAAEMVWTLNNLPESALSYLWHQNTFIKLLRTTDPYSLAKRLKKRDDLSLKYLSLLLEDKHAALDTHVLTVVTNHPNMTSEKLHEWVVNDHATFPRICRYVECAMSIHLAPETAQFIYGEALAGLPNDRDYVHVDQACVTILRELAYNPNTPAHILSDLALHQKEGIRRYAVHNPNTPQRARVMASVMTA